LHYIKVTKPATAATPIPITIGESNTPPPAAGAAPPPYLLIGSIASGLLAFDKVRVPAES